MNGLELNKYKKKRIYLGSIFCTILTIPQEITIDIYVDENLNIILIDIVSESKSGKVTSQPTGKVSCASRTPG